MQYRKLGRSGLDVSVLGFGTWQIGGGRWKAMSDDDSIALLRRSADLGVNVYDAAHVYGQYRHEDGLLSSHALELLGKAFGDGSVRDSTYICLKLGQLDEFAHFGDYSPRRVVEDFRHALKLLHRESVDICLVHAPSLAQVEDGRALAVLETLKALGLVRAIGYSFENEPDHVRAALAQVADVIMLQYNLIDIDCAAVLDEAWRHGVGVLVGGPFKRGYLSGQYRSVKDLSLDDGYWHWAVNHNPDKVGALLNRANQLMSDAGGTPSALRRHALRHVLSKPAVGSAIVGHRRTEEVEDNLNALADVTMKPHAHV